MSTQTVVEVDSFTDDTDELFYDDLASAGVVGVVIKVSQGDRWTLHDAPAKVRRALSAGLHVGALHYLEPGRTTMDAERQWFVGNLPEGSYALGLVVELDDLGGRQIYELATEVQGMVEGLATAGYVPGVRLSPELAVSLTANIAGARLWLGGAVGATGLAPFAESTGRHLDASPVLGEQYRLLSGRMLNAGDTGGRQVAIAEPADPQGPTDPGEDGHGPAESPVPGTVEGQPEVPTPATAEPNPDAHEEELDAEPGSIDPAEAAARSAALALTR